MEQINLLFDLSFIQWTGYAGVSNYAYTLIRGFELLAKDVVNLKVLIRKEYVPTLMEQTHFAGEVIVLDESDLAYLSKTYSKIFITYPHEDRFKGIDLVISPYVGPNMILFRKIKQIGVVHDLQMLSLGRKRKNKLPFIREFFFYRLLYKKIKHLVTISNNTYFELKKFSTRESTVIYNSLRLEKPQFTVPQTLSKESRPYILDVNSFYEYKNAKTLILAFDKIKSQIPHILYFKGNKNCAYFDHLKNTIVELGLTDRVVLDTSDLSQAELNYLYKQADLFVSPSLMEGFGFTPVEACIIGTRVLVSDIPTLREVTQNKVNYFNPLSVEELSTKMLGVLNEKKDEDKLAEISCYFQQFYSLEKQIQSFLDLIKGVVNKVDK